MLKVPVKPLVKDEGVFASSECDENFLDIMLRDVVYSSNANK